MVLSLAPANRSVKPSLRPTKPLETVACPLTVVHGTETASADDVEFGSEATSMVRLFSVSVRELSAPCATSCWPLH